MKDLFVYCVRDKSTGKMVSNLTNPEKKFWQVRGAAVNAMKYPHSRSGYSKSDPRLELVTYKLIEVEENLNE